MNGRGPIHRLIARAAGDSAASAVITFLVSGILYASIFAFVVGYQVSLSRDSQDADHVEISSRARDALDLILSGAGITESGSTEWHEDADNIARFGLSEPNRPNLVNYSKIEALRHASLEAATNGYADYEEVKDALGLDGFDFHIRTYPVLISQSDANWAPYKGLAPAYLASYGSPTASASLSLSQTNKVGYHEISATITNGATASAIFRVSFLLEADGSTIAVDDQYTSILGASGSDTITMRYFDADWDEPAYDVRVRVWDPYGQEVATITAASLVFDTAGSPDVNLIVDAGGTHFVAGNDVVIHMDHYEGDGTRISSGTSAILAIVDPLGTEIVNTTVSLPKNKAKTYTCPAITCAMVGEYTVKIMRTTSTQVVPDIFHVTATDMFSTSSSPSAEATAEILALQSLFANFDGILYDASTAPDGDVFSDADHSTRDMVSVLGNFDVLIVGSGVKQSALTTAEVKYGVADWVNAGGHLIVLGSGNQNYQWMQPLHGSGVVTASGGVTTPDSTHPILHVPEPLAWQRYDDQGLAWQLKEEELYTHVISKPDGANGRAQDTLAVSKPGVFNNGSVILTTYKPSALTNPKDDAEAAKFLHNLVTHSYQMLFLDYGPSIPKDAAVGSSSRLAMIEHPSIPNGLVEVQIVMYVFR